MKSYRMKKLPPERHIVWNLLQDTDSYYLNHHVFLVDFTAVEKAREAMASGGRGKPSYVAFALYAISRVMRRHPRFNSYLREYPTAKLALYDGVDICLTAEIKNAGGGKSVALSVIRHADDLRFDAFVEHLAGLKETTRESMPEYRNYKLFKMIPNFIRMTIFRLFIKPFPEKMRDIAGTCAFTSVGKYGVDFTTPLSPKTITFSLGRVAERPMAVGGNVVPRLCANITLTYDHRVADGADCAALGSDLRDAIENFSMEDARHA